MLLVVMTKSVVDPEPTGSSGTECWPLHEAKARLSELLRSVHRNGPQRISTHGRDEVVVISAEEYARLKGGQDGAELLRVMRMLPHPDLEFEFDRVRGPVRDVEL